MSYSDSEAGTVTARVVTDRSDDVASRRHTLREWLPALRYCAAVYLVVRIALFLLGAAAWALGSEQASITPGGRLVTLTNGWHNAITGWNKMDSLWFLAIAQHGYSSHNGTAAFYPAYPMLIRFVGYMCLGHLLLAAYLVSNIALLSALVIFCRLTEREYDLHTARRAVLYLCLFPTAFFLFDTYSESLFLLAAAGAFALARRGRWGWAGLVGVGATLTRSLGVVVVLALAAEAIHQTVEDRRALPDNNRRLLSHLAFRLVASTLPLAGTAGYLMFWQLRYQDWYRPFRLEKTFWERDFSAPWQTLWRGLIVAFRSGSTGGGGFYTLDFVLVAMGLALGIWIAVRSRPIYVVYTWGSILLFLSAEWPSRPLVSDPRYLAAIFPLAWALAWLGRRPGVHRAAVGLSAVSMATVAWLFLSTNGIF